MIRRWILGVLQALLLVAVFAQIGCGEGAGGSGAGASAVGGSTSGASTTTLDVFANRPNLDSDGKTPVVITAIAKDVNNVVAKNQPVTIATSDRGASITQKSSKTGDDGTVTAEVRIVDPTLRRIPVAVVSGAARADLAIDVVGTSLTLSGPTTIVAGGNANLTGTLRDSSKQPISGAPVTFSSSAGSTFSPSTVTTDSSGQFTVTVTPSASASSGDTISASAFGAVAVLATRTSPSNLTFVTPASASEIVVSSLTVPNLQTITVNLVESGVPAASKTIGISTTRGQFASGSSTTSVTTDASGTASTTISSLTAGATTITATAPDGTQQTLSVEFVSRTAAQIALQPSPGTVPVNLSTAGQQSSAQLIARVRDSAGNPVKGVVVAFAADTDPSSGTIAPGQATTDSQGAATSAFIPGPNSTGNNAIVIRATVVSTPSVTTVANLTAARRALQIRFGTGNKLLSDTDKTYYEIPWIIIVTDASGNPQPNVLVQPDIVPTKFYKGQMVLAVAPASGWVRQVDQECNSEDQNANQRLDTTPAEDVNGNGTLDPGNVTVIRPDGGVSEMRTDTNGSVKMFVRYPQNYALWVEVRLRVKATVDGTEFTQFETFLLPVLADDVKDPLITPPNLPQPTNLRAGC